MTSRSLRFATHGEVPRLFRGTLAARQIASLERGDTSESLSEREVELHRVPSSPEGDAGLASPTARAIWLPKRLLDAATEYSLVAGGECLEFTTLTQEPAFVRIWPIEPVVAEAVFCLESSFSTEPWGDPRAITEDAVVSFGVSRDAGTENSQTWTQLAHSPPCWLWQARQATESGEQSSANTEVDLGDGETNQPVMPGVAVQPTWFASVTEQAPRPAQCADGELGVASACAVVEDDRILVRADAGQSLWRVEGDAEAWFVLEPGRTGVVRGLEPGKQQALRMSIHHTNAPTTVQAVTVAMGPVRPRVVVNEVLADPVGAEPDQEWVELYNDGASPVNLEGWALRDEGGEMRLPAGWLAPSGYALLVNDTYLSNAVGEPVPDPNALILRVPVLARSGLANGGEALRLVDKSDMVVASFPGTPKPTPGVSVARGAPWQLDEPTAFGHHAMPGASPGAANRLQAPTPAKQ